MSMAVICLISRNNHAEEVNSGTSVSLEPEQKTKIATVRINDNMTILILSKETDIKCVQKDNLLYIGESVIDLTGYRIYSDHSDFYGEAIHIRLELTKVGKQ